MPGVRLAPDLSIKTLLWRMRARHKEGERFALSDGEVETWCEATGLNKRKLLDDIAAELAVGFHEGQLTFSFCDSVVDGLVGEVCLSWGNERWPDLFWKVFLAVDEGEYYREGRRHEDPVEVYTRPLIAEIVECMRSRRLPTDNEDE